MGVEGLGFGVPFRIHSVGGLGVEGIAGAPVAQKRNFVEGICQEIMLQNPDG